MWRYRILNAHVCFPENDTVEVVNVVMNNMENYLPSDVVEQDKER